MEVTSLTDTLISTKLNTLPKLKFFLYYRCWIPELQTTKSFVTTTYLKTTSAEGFVQITKSQFLATLESTFLSVSTKTD